MKKRKIKVRKVSQKFFEKKLRDLTPPLKYQIRNFIESHCDEIEEFGFGHIPRQRVMQITTVDGQNHSWFVYRK